MDEQAAGMKKGKKKKHRGVLGAHMSIGAGAAKLRVSA